MPANSIFSDPVTSTCNAKRSDENPFPYNAKKEDRKAKWFQILHFYWSFSSGIMAVMGLNMRHLNMEADGTQILKQAIITH